MGVGIPLAMMGASVLGGAMDIFGANQANQANAHQAELNREFQQYNSDTAYQRAVKDIKAAGLNPALAYSQGGASSPSGATAHMENTMAGAKGTAQGVAEAFSRSAAIKQQAASTDLTEAQATLLKAQTADLVKQTEARAAAESTNASYLAHTLGTREELAASETDRSRLGAQRERLGQQTTRLTNDYLDRTLDARTKMIGQQLRAVTSNADLLDLAKPEAESEANFYKSHMGQFSPFINNGLSTARDLVNLYASIKSGMPTTSTSTESHSYDDHGRESTHRTTTTFKGKPK